MTLVVTHMPVAAVARLVGEHDTRLWRVVTHYVEAALARLDLTDLASVAIDETAARRGHDYITLFVDIDKRRVVYIADGRGADTVRQFADHVDAHNSDASRIKEVCIDMSGAFIKGVTENLTEAEITFDKFHAVKLVNDAVDHVRRAEVKSRAPELEGTRYAWTRNAANLTAAQAAELAPLTKANLKTARAYHLRLAFQDICREPSRHWAEIQLERETVVGPSARASRRSRTSPATIERHWDGILAWCDSPTANGLIEGMDSLVQAAKAKARGYRSLRNLEAMTYLIAGKLDLELPT